MRNLFTEIIIETSVEKAWDALIDLRNYSLWNSFITPASFDLKKNAKVILTLNIPQKKLQTVKVKIIEVAPPFQIRWLGHFYSIPGIIDGEHIFQFEKISESLVRFIHQENFRGILVPFVWKSYLCKYLLQEFVNFNKDLKYFLEDRKQ